MTRYWVIAPFDVRLPEIWERVWQFDLANGIISIGWGKLGDPSNLSESELKDALQREFNSTRPSNMLWNFYRSIQAGDVVIARRGRKG